MAIDLMKNPAFRKVVERLCGDQGDVAVPTDFVIPVEVANLEAADRYLRTLSDGDLDAFCCTDYIDGMVNTATDQEGALAAWRLVDAIYMEILGWEK
jgi:hypothetical protein